MHRSFAIVPAAGRSVRMGAHKLLLPFAGRAVIEHVLAAWTASGVTRTVVVVRADDEALIALCRAFSVDLVTPSEPPADMKASVQIALRHIAETYAPNDGAAWLLAPADMPRLSTEIIDRVLQAYLSGDAAAVALFAGAKRGHPIAMPWLAARAVFELGASEGVDALVDRLAVRRIAVDSPEIFDDLDVPSDYARLKDEPTRPAAVFP